MRNVKTPRVGPRPSPRLVLWLRELDSYANATYGVRSLVREMRLIRVESRPAALVRAR